jgi:hypothetical protein
MCVRGSSEISLSKRPLLYDVGHYWGKYDTLVKIFIPLAKRSKAWVCSRSPAEIAGSNPAGGMDVCLL